MQEKLQVKIKRLNDKAVLPKYAKNGDAGMDLVAIDIRKTRDFFEYETGLAIELPPGYVGLVFPRSSISERPHSLCNAVGVIDSSYRGPIRLRMRTKPGSKTHYRVGEKVGQLVIMPYPQIELVETNELTSTERGAGGFGSTNK